MDSVVRVMPSMRVVDVFLKYLKAEGAKVFFGIPGGLLHPLFEAIEADVDLKLVVTKHEEGASFMADGYARVGKRLAVCCGTAGPGSTNLLTGVACAYADGVPMLVVTGQAASAVLGKGAAQEATREDMDIVEMFRPVTKYSTMVTSPASMTHHLRRALRRALNGRPGPVHLNVTVDVWEKLLEEDWFEPSTYRPETHLFDRRNVQKAATALIGARHPVILAGSGVGIAGAEEHLITLAELLSAKVATTPRAKGIFPEDHPLSVGILGMGGHRSAREMVFSAEVDVLLTAGASLNETATLNWNPNLQPSDTLIQLDIDSDRVGRNYPVDVPLVGDAQTILTELVYHLHRMIREKNNGQSQWPEGVAPSMNHDHYDDPKMRELDDLPLKPQRWRAELHDALPDNAVIFSDIGGHMLFNFHHLCIRRGQKFVVNLGFGSVGHGTVAPIGAAMADSSRPMVAIIGDACFTMNGMDLITAREHDVPVVWIIENNNMHGITWYGSQLVGSKKPLKAARYKRPLEIAAIARSMGLAAWLVERPGQIQDAVSEALSRKEPAVIEVRIDPEIPPPLGDRAKSVAGFIDK